MEIFRPAARATVITFPILDLEGRPRTGATSLDSESIAWADTPGFIPQTPGFADLTNEATELGTTGLYFLSLTSGELPAASPYVMIRVISGNAATQYILIRTASLYANVQGISEDSVAADNAESVFDNTGFSMSASTIGTATNLTTNNDKTGYQLSATGVDDIWDEVITNAHGTDNTSGLAMRKMYFASPFSSLSIGLTPAAVDTIWDEDIVLAHSSDNTSGLALQKMYFASPFSAMTIGTVTNVTTLSTNAIAAGSFQAGAIDATAIGTAAIDADAIAANAIGASELAADAVLEIADGVWDEVIVTGHLTDNTAGLMAQRMYFASPFSALTIGTVNAVAGGAITSASFAAGAVDATAIAANAIGASELGQDAAQEVADEVLNRDLAGSASGNTYNVRNALRRLRNRVQITGSNMIVYQENDTASAYSMEVTTAAGNPITEVDPIT